MRLVLLSLCLVGTCYGDDKYNNSPFIKKDNLLMAAKEKSTRKQVQYLTSTEEERIRKMIPKLDHPEHNDRMAQATIYDESTRWRVHQDATALDMSTRLLGSQYNISIGGQHLHEDGTHHADRFGNGNREYPWKFTAGVFDSTQSKQIKLLYVPDGKYIETSNGPSRGYVQWKYPVGTSIYELLINTSTATQYVYAVRIRTKVEDTGNVAVDWSPDEFIPFVNRKEYLQATLSNPGPVKEYSIPTTHEKAIGAIKGNLEELVPLDEDVVVAVMKNRAFKSRVGQEWAPGVDGVVTTKPGQIVAPDYSGMLFEVSKASCARCHQDTMKDVASFDSPRDWYGKLRGSADGVFSWHPFDDTGLRGSGYIGTGVRWDPASLELVRRK